MYGVTQEKALSLMATRPLMMVAIREGPLKKILAFRLVDKVGDSPLTILVPSHFEV